MPEDTEGIQTEEQVSKEEQVSEDKSEKTDEPVALTEERVQQLIAEATARAVEQGKNLGRRELQSAQDRNRAETERAQRRASQLEGIAKTAKARLQETDPDAAKDIEISELRARDAESRLREQQEAARVQQEEFHNQFLDNLAQYIKGLGVDTRDKRIDWAEDAQSYLEAQNRVLVSVSKIQEENVKTMTKGFEERLKSVESKLKQANIDVNSVETTTSGGAVAGSDADFIKKFANQELPMTQENIDRYNKIQDSYD